MSEITFLRMLLDFAVVYWSIVTVAERPRAPLAPIIIWLAYGYTMASCVKYLFEFS